LLERCVHEKNGKAVGVTTAKQGEDRRKPVTEDISQIDPLDDVAFRIES